MTDAFWAERGMTSDISSLPEEKTQMEPWKTLGVSFCFSKTFHKDVLYCRLLCSICRRPWREVPEVVEKISSIIAGGEIFNCFNEVSELLNNIRHFDPGCMENKYVRPFQAPPPLRNIFCESINNFQAFNASEGDYAFLVGVVFLGFSSAALKDCFELHSWNSFRSSGTASVGNYRQSVGLSHHLLLTRSRSQPERQSFFLIHHLYP